MSIKESMYSRVIAKPRPKTVTYIKDVADFEQDVQEKIDYLRKKMLVTKKREKVIREESSELTASTAEDVIMLIRNNDRMQASLNEALYSEVDTVRNALRTHPLFQMAMTNKKAEETIIWLEDKIFDLTKYINRQYCSMCSKKAKLDEIEIMVGYLEKFPRPGSSPYEIDLQERLTKIGLEIELASYRRTTAAVLQKKYKEVKGDIEKENVQFEIILREMEKKIDELFNEKQIMDNILCVAQKFQKQKIKDLADFEKAYNANYKIRRSQLKKKRKQTEEKLEQEERNAVLESRRIQQEQQKIQEEQGDPKKTQKMTERRTILLEKIDQYKTKVSRLQEVMRVENIDLVIDRMRHVVWLAYQLEREAVLKSQLQRALEKQRNNLLLLRCHLKYSGFVQDREYTDKKAELLEARLEIEDEVKKIHEQMNKLTVTSREAELGMFQMLKKLGDHHKGPMTYKMRIKNMYSLMENLKDELLAAREGVNNTDFNKRFVIRLLRPVRIDRRLVRVGTPPPSDAEGGDIEDAAQNALADRAVPSRAQMKERSQRFLKRIKMKRGEGM